MEHPAPPMADRPLSELLERLAAPTPAPGGGSAAALACALAAGLVEMAAGLGTARATVEEPQRRTLERSAARAAALRDRALELAEIELYAYEPVLQALRLSGQDPERDARIDSARAQACASPLAIAQAGAELAGLAAAAADVGSPHLTGDAIAAALLAEGGCRAAAALVAINLAGAPDDPRADQAAVLAQAAAQDRARALATAVKPSS